MRTWGLLVVVVLTVGSCVLPGRAGWECDGAGDCQPGLQCRSMQSDRGYSSVCMRPGENVYVGCKGNWLMLMIGPLVVLSAAVGIGSRIAAARKRKAADEPLPRRRR